MLKGKQGLSWVGFKHSLGIANQEDGSFPIDFPQNERSLSLAQNGFSVTDDYVLVSCKTCDKTVLASAFASHLACVFIIENCYKSHNNQLYLQIPPKQTATVPTLSSQILNETNSPESSALLGPKKKRKRDEFDTIDSADGVEGETKEGGPIDYDRHCGVMTDQGPCARSITWQF
ncbi:hypothetical protein HK096_001382 [Nowakowskiella sp. JEL0078]|nr:hypothetical protein HK096_001382 [Nowakowskiella sp. JEL0078]